jgi:ring-1,2-phenylacetyl-CoA epoxidase subunit PaaD
MHDPVARRSLGTPLRSAAMPETVECPFCRGAETEQFSAFGSALSVSQYYCRSCRTVFEWMKRAGGERPADRG